ncbi:hypothetical protein K9M78_04665 [Candidatus Bipolaricaulota bacterium]|nr:hypothetical protein [Candidatus Bipolaricaulota bacterium]
MLRESTRDIGRSGKDEHGGYGIIDTGESLSKITQPKDSINSRDTVMEGKKVSSNPRFGFKYSRRNENWLEVNGQKTTTEKLM